LGEPTAILATTTPHAYHRDHQHTATMQPTRILQGMRYRKLRLTTKDVNKGYYKGVGTGSMGRHTKYGTYVIQWEKVRTYVVPPLEGFKVCLYRVFC
jgi:hypothetical protein